MSEFHSNEACFDAVRALITRLEQRGHVLAAAELREGFQCLNGLTDGWALFLHSIEKVEAVFGKGFDRGDREVLKSIRKAARAVVYRR